MSRELYGCVVVVGGWVVLGAVGGGGVGGRLPGAPTIWVSVVGGWLALGAMALVGIEALRAPSGAVAAVSAGIDDAGIELEVADPLGGPSPAVACAAA